MVLVMHQTKLDLEKEKKPYPYKHRRKVTITLESNNFPKMQNICWKYYSTGSNIKKQENDPEDLENYVAISAVQEDIKEDENNG